VAHAALVRERLEFFHVHFQGDDAGSVETDDGGGQYVLKCGCVGNDDVARTSVQMLVWVATRGVGKGHV
jgi:hypothetical protein